MAKSRLIGGYPVIGIRPTIDGRRGPLKVRESLEVQTMNMAKNAAKLLTDNLFYTNGEPVKVVIADTTIGRVAEAAACAEKFKKEGVEITITVTPCWCYGSETMDMDPNTIKAVWGFNGTERPGAVYLAAVLAGHAQKGLPAFGIYGHDVQDLDDTSIPADVAEKLLRFGRAAVAAATMRGKSYLQIGSICMGIAGSIVDVDFFEDYLGMRVESVDEVEIIRRMTEGVYNEKEYQKALAWVKEKCNADFDKNPEYLQRSAEQKEKDWEFTAKMACIIKDLMNGNADLPEGCEEEMVGHNAIAADYLACLGLFGLFVGNEPLHYAFGRFGKLIFVSHSKALIVAGKASLQRGKRGNIISVLHTKAVTLIKFRLVNGGFYVARNLLRSVDKRNAVTA